MPWFPLTLVGSPVAVPYSPPGSGVDGGAVDGGSSVIDAGAMTFVGDRAVCTSPRFARMATIK